MNNLVRKFREKLSKDGRSLRWFQTNYLSEMNYMSFIQQINDYYSVDKNVENAMKKYLAE